MTVRRCGAPGRTGVLGVLVAVAALGCSGGPGATASPPLDSQLARVADDYWSWYLTWHPLEATYLGRREFNDRVEDISPRGREARREGALRLAEALETVDPAALGFEDRLTWMALRHQLDSELVREACEPEIWAVDHREGFQLGFLNIASVQPLETPEDGQRMIRRWEQMADYIDDYISNLRSGLERGRVAARPPVDRTIVQLDALLQRPTEEWPVYSPAGARLDGWPEEARHDFRRAIRETATGRIRPAYERLRDVLRDEVYPRTRSEDRPGLTSLPGGIQCYRGLIEDLTTLDLSPREIYDAGAAELARIRQELEDLGASALGTPDLAALQRRLRDDPAFHFRWPGEIVRAAEEATRRAETAMPLWFGHRPGADLLIRPIPLYEAPQSVVAYYRQPAPDGSRPGIYFVNTYRPEIRPRYQAEVLTFHESIPGHHLQTAIAQELTGLPEFRRHLGSTAYVEGWALYAERLADEMGLYSGDLDRIGMLSYDAWRASRLMVDTGLHAFGWSRQQAIDFLRDNTLLSPANIENEVDRYITSPAQALTYKLGQLEILRLRSEARDRLGERFRMADFHDRVLENGALPLPALREAIERWVQDAERTRPAPGSTGADADRPPQ